MMIYCIFLEDLAIQCGKKTWKKSREGTLKKKNKKTKNNNNNTDKSSTAFINAPKERY